MSEVPLEPAADSRLYFVPLCERENRDAWQRFKTHLHTRIRPVHPRVSARALDVAPERRRHTQKPSTNLPGQALPERNIGLGYLGTTAGAASAATIVALSTVLDFW